MLCTKYTSLYKWQCRKSVSAKNIMFKLIYEEMPALERKAQQLDNFFSYTGLYSSVLPFLLRASLLGTASGFSDMAATVLVLTDAVSVLYRGCRICSLGLFQEGRVAIHSMNAPNTAISNPSTLTNVASGGESLYFGSFLCDCKTKHCY